MTNSLPMAAVPPRRLGRSIAAIAAGFVPVAVLSLGTDEVLHLLEVYPPWGAPMYDPWLNLLALSYRTVFTILGGYVTAWLAPRAPMRHVLVGALLGLVAGTAGAIGAISVGGLGPIWYPIALAISGPFFVWLGGLLYVRRM